MQIGYHVSHEQFGPAELLGLAQAAERHGFEALLSSDHFAPWTRDGESGFAWSWLGAAAVSTSLPLGVVSAPGQRYHPAVLAQAIATVEALAPGRLTPALGSGQALNEHVTGDPWPPKDERNVRLAECADVITRLLDGETVDHRGTVRVDRAHLYSAPASRPPILAAALTPESAADVAAWSDGLITVNAPWDTMREVIGAYRDAGGAGRPVHVQVHVSWAPDEETARRQAVEHWAFCALEAARSQDLELPSDFDAATRSVRVDDVADAIVISADDADHVEWLAQCSELGVERVYVHQVGPDQDGFIRHFGEHVLPRVRDRLRG
ncbi:TIGR03885 family FMN-dependent LLM class oxidoreductase [Aeromicrobium sp. Marseille-Q0843]|uniref:TIGR03885 family FMN-dependent LLM class oxidoreductase n=1 Tax=Aeromicrobium phoceense TaxID=2754045 RepID=A0A838XKX0_9ACTN|nr:TIGR03885 family FMN-dependent LLM class oxidoreductase [Aeromicrobium phoceense]MBA4609641.1 TIGR03885 family FMN-dependent LLM class oxidoreductase [Aeromicrobium phoceense]